MSDGQRMKTLDEIRASCTNPNYTAGPQLDYLNALESEYELVSARLAEIRKKGGWMEGVPEEDGVYWIKEPGSAPEIVWVYNDADGLDVCWGEDEGVEPVLTCFFRGCRFAHILTPEDLE